MMARLFPMTLTGEFTPETTVEIEAVIRDEGDHYAIEDYFGVTIYHGKQPIDSWEFDDKPELQPAIRAAAERAVTVTAKVHARQVEYTLSRRQNAA